jgi:Tfp pilus assembly protein PilX
MWRSNERGVAIVMALFMTLLVSAIAAAMAHVARTETLSSQSYTTMSQARYAAESGLAAAANYLLSSGYVALAPGTASDPLTNYNTSGSPVLRSGAAVQLSTTAGQSTGAPSTVVQAFATAATGTLSTGWSTVQYGARARLVAMRRITDTMAGTTIVLQSWEITGTGRIGGSGSADVEVTAVIERQTVSAFRYAAFAADQGCGALRFAGGATTSSYNSQALNAGSPVIANTAGDVGTNGNLILEGSTTNINGTLSTPRTGVGSCTTSNVTALAVQGNATVSGGLIELPQIEEYPTPPAPSPLPPTTGVAMDGGFTCASLPNPASCSKSGGTITLTPTSGVPYVLGNLTVQSGNTLVMNPGTYVFNSIVLSGNSTLQVPTGSSGVVIKIAGQGTTTPINLTGGVVSNPSYDASRLQFIYGGTGSVYVAGGTATSAIVYAPQADLTVTGNGDFYGAIVGGTVDVPGSSKLHYDTNLANSAVTAGNPVMSSFTWRTF